MDTVFVLLNESSQSWWAANAYWWVPVLTVIATILGIYFSTRTSIRNTNKQISNSINSTEKQIKNQNKENHRPYLRIFDVNDSNEDFFNAYLSVKNNEELNPQSESVKTKIKIMNMGYGIATNILLLGFANTVITRAGVDEKAKTGKLFSVLDIDLSEDSITKVSLISNNNSTDTTYDLMLFYTDLNNNIYSTMLLIQVKNNKFWNLYYYPKGSLNFDDILEKRSVKYKNLERKYIRWQLGKN